MIEPRATMAAALAALAALACGGAQQEVREVEPEGDGETVTADPTASAAVDAGAPAERQPPPPPDAGPPPSAVTFALANGAAEELVFSVDRGWQPVIFAYSGKPPKAKPILMFPKFCTASCEAEAEDRCPSCPQPEKVKDIKAAEKRETAAPGKAVRVPWDGQVYVYEKTRGGERNRKCECWKKVDPPAGEYTVKACGFRVATSVGQSSKLQCVETTMTLPPAAPLTVTLEFPAVK